jgi:hypothetical protein
MCTTSVECKTIMIVMLTVKSNMDLHMISWDVIWLSLGFLFVKVGFTWLWVSHGETP